MFLRAGHLSACRSRISDIISASRDVVAHVEFETKV